MPSEIVLESSKLMKQYGLTIAFAESATAGRMASEYALTPESGSVLMGGIVCYDAGIKKSMLKISSDYMEKYTPESAEVTKKMALNLGSLIDSDIRVATTGLITPGGSESGEKPVGTMFVHIIFEHRSIALRKVCCGTPEDIMLQAIDMAAHRIVLELGNA
jgi:nicotinamide-nucleotide amidase